MQKILFLHGLESGTQGSKARYLRERFPGRVVVPDLKMSMSNLLKENSFARSFLRVCTLQHGLSGILHPRHTSVWDSVQRCLGIARRQLQEHPDIDVIVGSSWGGAIALCLLAEMEPPAKTWLILCPALKKVLAKTNVSLEKLYQDILSSLQKGHHRVLLVHGEQDETVPLEDSLELCRFLPDISLRVLPEEGHRLKSLLQGEGLSRLLEEALSQGSIPS
ncbi:MAG: hypothetical protein H6728_04435 [Myxococcales bacterium]|nr:hypothetical protein [Myxococcales bacterium]MCB9642300.1 hypothetical protein [Myxococcales bacterium]